MTLSKGDLFSASAEVVKHDARLDDIETVLGVLRLQKSRPWPFLTPSPANVVDVGGLEALVGAMDRIHERLKEKVETK